MTPTDLESTLIEDSGFCTMSTGVCHPVQKRIYPHVDIFHYPGDEASYIGDDAGTTSSEMGNMTGRIRKCIALVDVRTPLGRG